MTATLEPATQGGPHGTGHPHMAGVVLSDFTCSHSIPQPQMV